MHDYKQYLKLLNFCPCYLQRFKSVNWLKVKLVQRMTLPLQRDNPKYSVSLRPRWITTALKTSWNFDFTSTGTLISSPLSSLTCTTFFFLGELLTANIVQPLSPHPNSIHYTHYIAYLEYKRKQLPLESISYYNQHKSVMTVFQCRSHVI